VKLTIKIIKILLLSIGFLAILVVSLYGYRDIPLESLKSKYAPTPSSFTSINGMDVHFRDEGNTLDSIPLVLIHGTGSSLHTFDDWVTKLKQNHRVIRMDLPAYGLTGPFPDRNYSMNNYVNFIKDFLSTQGIKKCILGGNSLGGGISWRFAAKYPEMVDKLILIDATGYPSALKELPLAFKIAKIPVLKNLFTFITPRFIAKGSLENVYVDKTKVTEELVDRYFELTLREGNRQAFVDRFNIKNDINTHNKIKLITQSTLVLWGDQDKLIPVENAYKFHEDLPNDILVILKDVGHVPMEESPNYSLEPVISFLEN